MPRQPRRPGSRPAAPTSWDPLAAWYHGWVGEEGSEHHRRVALPAVMDLLRPQPGETVLDVGAGQGVLAPLVARAGAAYIGVDASPRLIQLARRQHGDQGRFIVGDARRLSGLAGIAEAGHDAVTFVLSLQDMDPLAPVLQGAAWALRPGGRTVLLLTHPAFRIPRQSGWGWDENRKLVYRRIDRYLTPLPVPMNPLPGKRAGVTTRSFHRPLESYVNGLAEAGLLVDAMRELPAHKLRGVGMARAEELARREIPLFLAVRARKLSTSH